MKPAMRVEPEVTCTSALLKEDLKVNSCGGATAQTKQAAQALHDPCSSDFEVSLLWSSEDTISGHSSSPLDCWSITTSCELASALLWFIDVAATIVIP